MSIILGLILFLLIILIGGDQGAKSIISTGMNGIGLLIVVFLIYIGFNPMVVTTVSCVAICYISIFYQNEVNIKSQISFISVLIILIILIPLVYYVADASSLQGFTREQYEITDSNGYSRNINIDMTLLQISVMLIALIGIIIDISVAISSSMYEIYANNKMLDKNHFFIAGMNVGRDVLSTSIHTIFYIYIAEYMTLMIQFSQDYSFVKMVNSKAFSQGFISIAISGIGCCLILPVVALVGVKLICKQEVPKEEL